MSLADLIRDRSSSASLEESSDDVTRSRGSADERGDVAVVSGGSDGSSSEDIVFSWEKDPEKPSEAITEAPVAVQTPSESQVPRGVSEVVTPSGISIYYQAAPKRLYRVNGLERPSVSTVLDILEKGGLSWWGMKVGIEGVAALVDMGAIYNEGNVLVACPEGIVASTDLIVEKLTWNKLTVNHVRDKAGGRGQSVHDALEAWAEKGVLPKVEVYAPEEQGYVQGLLDFLIDSGAEPLMSEVMVASVKHKYAGRFDLRASIPNDAHVIVKTYPRKRPLWDKLRGGEWLLDLKTSKGVYDTHYLQLEAYEEASKECGYEPTVQRGVIHVTQDGRYELAPSRATFGDFKAVLGAYRALEKLKAR